MTLKGTTGLPYSGSKNERVFALQGQEEARTYNLMSKDYQVQAMLTAIGNSIVGSNWKIEPTNDSEEQAKQIDLLHQILFNDIDIESHYSEINSFLQYGNSVFEYELQNFENKILGSYTGVSGLFFREQTTIKDYVFESKTGELLYVVQQVQGARTFDSTLGINDKLKGLESQLQEVKIPASQLLVIFHDKQGISNGNSILRGGFGPWQRKNFFQGLETRGIERTIDPAIVAITNLRSTDAEFTLLNECIEKLANGRANGVTIPAGTTIDTLEMTFATEDIIKAIKTEDENMAKSVLMPFIEMGTGGNSGSLALSEALLAAFESSLQAYGDEISRAINIFIKRLVNLNFGEQTEYPRLNITPKTSSTKTYAETLAILTGAGYLTPSPADEVMIRGITDLPNKQEGEGEELEIQEEEKKAEEPETEDESI